jgi:hypothetical protein
MTDEELNRRFDQLEWRVLESMRDMQTGVLRGLERFARGNFARMHRPIFRRRSPSQPTSKTAFN